MTSNQRLLAALACGLALGAACAVLLSLTGVVTLPRLRERAQPLDPEALDRAWVRTQEHEPPPRLQLQTDANLDRTDAWVVGTRYERHGADRVETGPGVVAFRVWENDGYAGFQATLCFGPERDAVRIRIASTGHFGPSYTPWHYVIGDLQLSSWPPDRPGTLVAFHLEGQTDATPHAFFGTLLVP